jgi:hypothetical protein
MKTGCSTVLPELVGIIVGTIAGAVCGQEKPAAVAVQPGAYDMSREVTLVGKVVSYSASSAVPPWGPHAKLQTASAMMDIHRGDARLLNAQHMAIESGDSLRIIGEEVTQASQKQFVARIVQKGTQAVVLRSVPGFPLLPAARQDADPPKTQGGMQ